MLLLETEEPPTDRQRRPSAVLFAQRAVAVVASDLPRLPSTVRLGLGVVGLFGLADVVAHLGVPGSPGAGSADAGQFVAHLGVLVGMVVVLIGILGEARGPRRATSRSARPGRGVGRPMPADTQGADLGLDSRNPSSGLP